MSIKKKARNKETTIKKIYESEDGKLIKDEDKILYGENKTVCFACGEHIEMNTDICPYCKTVFK